MKTASITIRLSENEKEKLVELANKKDISVSQLIRESFRKLFEEEN